MQPIDILGISGSLRDQSLNSALLRSAADRLPDHMSLEIYDGLRALPPYDQDLDESGAAPEVVSLRERIDAADGLLIATPEYNYSVPGVLKNLIDWASRPADDSSLNGKPVAIMGASPSPFGTVRAQLSLRQSFLWTDSRVVAKPEVLVFDASSRFDDDLRLTDETTADLVGMLLRSLERLVHDTRDAAAVVGT